MSEFPKKVWDGITPWRKKRQWNEPPKGRDFDEVIDEVIATQKFALQKPFVGPARQDFSLAWDEATESFLFVPPGGSHVTVSFEASWNIIYLPLETSYSAHWDVARRPPITRYVSPTGNNLNTGLVGSPWRTLQYAASQIGAGDTIIALTGSYNEGLNLFGHIGGAEDAPITIQGQNAIITHSATSGINASLAAFNIEDTGGWFIIEGFNIQSDGSIQRAGIRVALSDNCIIRNNTVNGAYIGFLTTFTSNTLIENNIGSNSTDQHGIYIGTGTTNSIIRGNEFFGNAWDGIHSNCNIQNPTKLNTIERNKIHGNTLSGMDIEGTSDCIIRNNLIYQNNKHGLTFHSLDQPNTPPSIRNLIINNTIVENGMAAIQLQEAEFQNEIYNNILHSNSQIYGAISVKGAPVGLLSDYNLTIDRFSLNFGDSSLTLTQWKTQTNQDAHSISFAALSDVFSTGYHLKSAGPAIDAGTSFQAPVNDLNGETRPKGTSFDIGAFEYNSDAPVPLTLIPEDGVDNVTEISVTFNKAVNVAGATFTVPGITGTLAYSANKWTFTPTSPVDPDTTYTATVSGVVDTSGNPTSGDVIWRFTTAGPLSVGPFTLFADEEPAVFSANDSLPISLGLKFHFAQALYVTKIRFYKSTLNTGTHIGRLFRVSDSKKLAETTFTGETASGWQSQSILPVLVPANTDFIISYFAPNARYSYRVDTYPKVNELVTGSEGLFSYEAEIPDQSFNNTAYFVDIEATGLNPPPNSLHFPINSPIKVTFNKPVVSHTIAIAGVAATKTYSGNTITLTPNANLANGTQYTVTLTTAQTASGETIGPISWTFTSAYITQTLFNNTGTPATVNGTDNNPIETGTKFHTTVNGKILGGRFYKGTLDTGTHTLRLWQGSTLVASKNFIGETASGWQEIIFDTPVDITANTDYVLSVFHSSTYFVLTNSVFPLTVGNIVATNGGYRFFTTGPPDNLNTTNYWVDVIFAP